MRHALVLLALVSLVLTACVSQKQPRSQAYVVDANGTVSAGTRSALDGTPAPGRQELIAFYIPPILNLPGAPDFRAGVTVDPSGLQLPIIIPPPTLSAPAPYAAPQGCASTTRTVMVPETYYESVTTQVPRTRMVPRTETVPAVTVPVPQAAPTTGCPTPPPAPPIALRPPADVCVGDSCAIDAK